MMNRVIALGTCALLVGAMLSGCGNSGKLNQPTTEEKTENQSEVEMTTQLEKPVEAKRLISVVKTDNKSGLTMTTQYEYGRSEADNMMTVRLELEMDGQFAETQGVFSTDQNGNITYEELGELNPAGGEEPEYFPMHYEFDENGNLLYARQDVERDTYVAYTFARNEYGLIVSRTAEICNQGEKQERSVNFNYEYIGYYDNGQPKEALRYSDVDDTEPKCITYFDSNGRMIEEINIYEGFSISKYEYNSDGKLAVLTKEYYDCYQGEDCWRMETHTYTYG